MLKNMLFVLKFIRWKIIFEQCLEFTSQILATIAKTSPTAAKVAAAAAEWEEEEKNHKNERQQET